MSNEEVIQQVTKDMLANGKYPPTLFVSGTERSERVRPELYCPGDCDGEEGSEEVDSSLIYHNIAHAGFNFAANDGAKNTPSIGELERLFYIECGSIGVKPDDIEAVRIDCSEVKNNKSYISVLRIVRSGKRVQAVEPYMMQTKDGKKAPLIYKKSDNPIPYLEAFMRGYTDGCGMFEKV